MTPEIQFQIECLSSDLIAMLVETYQWGTKRALDEYYSSGTFQRICNPETGLYYESPIYVFSFLKNEIEKGVVA